MLFPLHAPYAGDFLYRFGPLVYLPFPPLVLDPLVIHSDRDFAELCQKMLPMSPVPGGRDRQDLDPSLPEGQCPLTEHSAHPGAASAAC